MAQLWLKRWRGQEQIQLEGMRTTGPMGRLRLWLDLCHKCNRFSYIVLHTFNKLTTT